MTAWLNVVGVGEGGVAALPGAARALVADARVVLGPERFLAELGAERTEGQQLLPWTPPLERMLEQVERLRGAPSVILATGDPMWFGIGATLARRLRPEEIRVVPYPSAFQLAASRLSWPLQHVVTLSLHGRPVELLHPHLSPGNRIVALTSDAETARSALRLLEARGYGGSLVTLLEQLGGAAERTRTGLASALDLSDLGDFYVLAIDCVADDATMLLPQVPGLPDAAFVHDGQLTKRDVRAATLARLAPYPGALLWDVGAGCGSVSIEWMRAARDARAIAVEQSADRARMIGTNAAALGVPGLAVVEGRAPAALVGLQPPDAVFIGGAVADEAVFAAAWSALRRGGRLVANAVTLGGEAALLDRAERFGGEVTRIAISSLDRIGGELVLRPRLPVLQWAAVKS